METWPQVATSFGTVQYEIFFFSWGLVPGEYRRESYVRSLKRLPEYEAKERHDYHNPPIPPV